MASYED
jgi:hypothetical protein